MVTGDFNYQIISKTDLNSCSMNYLYDLYLPIIGYKAAFLYQYFENKFFNNNRNGNMNSLINEIKFNNQEFLFNRRTLESIGLISTYANEIKGEMIIVLSGVSFPNDFFMNPILKGLFLSSTSDEYAKKIMDKYSYKLDLDEYVNISANVNDSFSLSFDVSKALDNKENKFVSKNKNTLKISFDEKSFKKFLKDNSQINYSAISDGEKQKIMSLASLYGFDEKIIAQVTIDSFDFSKPIGEKINFVYFENRLKKEMTFFKKFNTKHENEKQIINSETDLAKKINNYENMAPRLFLKSIQGGIEPVCADINLIIYLSQNLGLNNGVINCLVDYIISTNNGSFAKAYTTKIAASLVRNKIECALDCYNYLYSNKKSKTKDTFKTKENLQTNNNLVENLEEIDDSDPFGDD